ncbi:MAG: EpsG family protein [Bacteroides sp.]|nr:EpsG family protein [Bacteroides sp.]
MSYPSVICLTLLMYLAGCVINQYEIKRLDKERAVRYLPLLLAMGWLTLLTSFRGQSIGNDTADYMMIFEDVSLAGNYQLLNYRYEFGFLWLNQIFSAIIPDVHLWIAACGVFTCMTFYNFIRRYSDDYFLSLIFFITLGTWGQTMNILRQMLAIAICLISCRFILKNEGLKFLGCIFLATTLHYTAIIFIVAWWMNRITPSIRNICLFIILSILISINFGSVINSVFTVFTQYEHYGTSQYFGDVKMATYMKISVSSLLCGLWLIARTGRVAGLTPVLSKMDKLSFNLMLAGLCILIISVNFNLLDRVATYFSIFSIIAVPNALSKIKFHRNRLVLSSILILFLFAYYTLIVICRPEWNRIYPYHTWL